MVNFASGASGALGGAAAGSTFGPVGSAVGGLIGGVAGLFGSKKKKRKQETTFDPQQKGLYDQYIQGLSGGGGRFGNLFDFNANQANQVFDMNTARPAYRNFEENVIPQITGQFRGNNLQNSSYTGEALSRAGRNVQENLDALRADAQFRGQEQSQSNRQNAVQNALGMSTFAYGKQEPSQIDQILDTMAPQAGEWFSDFLKSRRLGNQGGGGLSGATGQFRGGY